MSHNRLALVAISAALLATTPAAAQWRSPAQEAVLAAYPITTESRLTPDEAAAVEAVINRYRDFYGLTGLNLAIVRDGQTVYRSERGFANVELGVPTSRQTRFQLSSTAKVITSITAMRLVEAGTLDLNAPISRYISEAPPSWAPITVRHLMQQRSGLPDLFSCSQTGVGDILTCLAAKPVETAPGARFHYNQTNSFLLQLAAERQTGLPWPELVSRTVFEPAGMHTVYSGSFREVVPDRATSYYPHDGGGLELRNFEFEPWNFGGAGPNSTVDDLLALEAALREGRLLRPDTLQAMWTTPDTPDGRPANYALMWAVRRHADGSSSFGHPGGFLTNFRTFPAHNLTVIALSNGSYRRFDPDDLAVDLAIALTPELAAPAQRLSIRMLNQLHASGIDAAVAEYENGKGDLALEPLVNALGYQLMSLGRTDDALAFFSLNVRDHPHSANAHDSLGEAYLATGDLERAKASYETALRLDPQSRSARDQLVVIEGRMARRD